MFIVFINASCFLIKVAMPKLVYIRVSSVGSVNLCAKKLEEESSYIRKEENYANFRTQILNDFESTSLNLEQILFCCH